MIIPVLVNVCHIEATPEEQSLIPSRREGAMLEEPLKTDDISRKQIRTIDRIYERPLLVPNEQSKAEDKFFDKNNRKIRRGRTSWMKNVDFDTNPKQTHALAQKLAKDALKSPKVQETIRKLAVVTPHGGLLQTVKVPSSTKKNNHGKSTMNKKRQHKAKHNKKKNGKNHHGRLNSRHSRWPKRGSPKKNFDITRHVNSILENQSGSRNLPKKRNLSTKNNVRSTESSSKLHDKLEIVNIEENDYIDATSTLNIQHRVSSTTTQKYQHSKVRSYENETMIERLMKTTTKDPRKKSPTDQGVEYSEYYSDDDVLEDTGVDRVRVKISDPRNRNDRVIRQTLNNLSSYGDSRAAGNAPAYPENVNEHGRDSGYEDEGMKSPNDFQNYPVAEEPGLRSNSRDFGVEESTPFNQMSDLSDKEEVDEGYPVNTEEIPRGPRIFSRVMPDLQTENEVRPVVEVPRYSGKIDYQSREPEIGNFNSIENEQALSIEITEKSQLENNNYAESKQQASGFQQNSVHESRLPENINNFGSNDPYTNSREIFPIRNSDRSTNHQSPVIEASQLSNLNQPKFYNQYTNSETRRNLHSPFYSNDGNVHLLTKNQQGQNQNSLSVLPNKNYNLPVDSPLINLPSGVMDQPFGKVLESLGVNIESNRDNQDFRSDSNSIHKIPMNFVLTTTERPVPPILAPSQLNIKPKGDWEDDPGKDNFGWADLEMLKTAEDSLHDKKKKRVENFGSDEAEYSKMRLHGRRNKERNEHSKFVEEGNAEEDGTDERTSISVAVNETKEVANQILGTIIDELEELKLEHAKNNKREGLPCRLSGTWSTTRAGVRLDIRVVNRTVSVALAEHKLATHRHDSLINATWKLSGQAPLKRGAPFYLVATDNHTDTLAVFLGACRVCQGIDTIAGVWSIAREPKDCRDSQTATSVFNDIFRKTKLPLVKGKQAAVNTNETSLQNCTSSVTVESTTLKNETEKTKS